MKRGVMEEEEDKAAADGRRSEGQLVEVYSGEEEVENWKKVYKEEKKQCVSAEVETTLKRKWARMEVALKEFVVKKKMAPKHVMDVRDDKTKETCLRVKEVSQSGKSDVKVLNRTQTREEFVYFVPSPRKPSAEGENNDVIDAQANVTVDNDDDDDTMKAAAPNVNMTASTIAMTVVPCSLNANIVQKNEDNSAEDTKEEKEEEERRAEGNNARDGLPELAEGAGARPSSSIAFKTGREAPVQVSDASRAKAAKLLAQGEEANATELSAHPHVQAPFSLFKTGREAPVQVSDAARERAKALLTRAEPEDEAEYERGAREDVATGVDNILHVHKTNDADTREPSPASASVVMMNGTNNVMKEAVEGGGGMDTVTAAAPACEHTGNMLTDEDWLEAAAVHAALMTQQETPCDLPLRESSNHFVSSPLHDTHPVPAVAAVSTAATPVYAAATQVVTTDPATTVEAMGKENVNAHPVAGNPTKPRPALSQPLHEQHQLQPEPQAQLEDGDVDMIVSRLVRTIADFAKAERTDTSLHRAQLRDTFVVSPRTRAGDFAFICRAPITCCGCAVPVRIFRDALLRAGADAKHVTEEWTAHHYALILWKLRGYDTAVAAALRNHDNNTRTRTRYTNVDAMARQLWVRYDTEFNFAQRSALRRVMEGDASSKLPMVLCVASTHDSLKSMSIVVTDGWYTMVARIDESLQSLTAIGLLEPGTKIRVVQAALEGGGAGAAPLSPEAESMQLCLSRNATRPEPWDAKLGFVVDHGRRRAMRLPLRDVIHGGGGVPSVVVVVSRVFPAVYMERDAKGRVIWRNERREMAAAESFRGRQMDALELAAKETTGGNRVEEDEADAILDAAGLGARDIAPLLQVLVTCASPGYAADALISIWRPREFHFDEIREGHAFEVSSLIPAIAPGSIHFPSGRRYLSMTATRATRWRRVAGADRRRFRPRHTRAASELSDADIGSTIDVAGAVIFRGECRASVANGTLFERWTFIADAAAFTEDEENDGGHAQWLIGVKEIASEPLDGLRGDAMWFQNVCVESRDVKNRVWAVSADKLAVVGSAADAAYASAPDYMMSTLADASAAAKANRAIYDKLHTMVQQLVLC